MPELSDLNLKNFGFESSVCKHISFKSMFKPVYLQALFVWIVYTLATKFLFIIGVARNEAFIAYSIAGVVSSLFGILFLYLFSHESFFKFAKVIERKEIKREKKWLNLFIHTGKISAVVLIGIIAGPLFAALTGRILLNKMRHRYLIVFIVSFTSTIFWLAAAKGTIYVATLNFLK